MSRAVGRVRAWERAAAMLRGAGWATPAWAEPWVARAREWPERVARWGAIRAMAEHGGGMAGHPGYGGGMPMGGGYGGMHGGGGMPMGGAGLGSGFRGGGMGGFGGGMGASVAAAWAVSAVGMAAAAADTDGRNLHPADDDRPERTARRRPDDQCRKWRRPVRIMAIPCSSQALVVSSSRLDPPG